MGPPLPMFCGFSPQFDPSEKLAYILCDIILAILRHTNYILLGYNLKMVRINQIGEGLTDDPSQKYAKRYGQGKDGGFGYGWIPGSNDANLAAESLMERVKVQNSSGVFGILLEFLFSD